MDHELSTEVQVALRTLDQAQDTQRMICERLIAVVTALDHNTTASLALRKDVFDMLQKIELRESSRILEDKRTGERLAKIEALVGIVRSDVSEVRENTGAHPLVSLDVDDTAKTVGKIMISGVKRGWKLFVAAAGGLTVGGVWHWFLDHFGKGH